MAEVHTQVPSKFYPYVYKACGLHHINFETKKILRCLQMAVCIVNGKYTIRLTYFTEKITLTANLQRKLGYDMESYYPLLKLWKSEKIFLFTERKLLVWIRRYSFSNINDEL